MRIRSTSKWWINIAVISALFGCFDGKYEETMKDVSEITAAEWQQIKTKRIVFGHQSVGKNILDGAQSLAIESGIDLLISESRSVSPNSGIIHFFVGENGDPSSKLKDFAAALESGVAGWADIALVKFCYIDFSTDTDARRLAEQYIATLDDLSRRFPNITFVAVTAPLTVAQSGPKAWIKRLLGRPLSGFADNARRQEFNQILRSRYSANGRLFDLATIESKGAPAQEYQGRPIEVLNPALTYDDGHLNTRGERLVASHLIKYLGTLSVGQRY